MTMHKTLHPRDDVDRLYVPRKEGRRGLASIQDSVDASIQRLEAIIKRRRVRLITTTRNNTDNTRINRTEITRKQKWEENNTDISNNKRAKFHPRKLGQGSSSSSSRISLTLSLHVSLSFTASGRSSGLHLVSSHSCCMYVRAGRPAFDWPYAGVHRSTSLTISSLLLQQCPACLVRLACIVFVIGGR